MKGSELQSASTKTKALVTMLCFALCVHISSHPECAEAKSWSVGAFVTLVAAGYLRTLVRDEAASSLSL